MNKSNTGIEFGMKVVIGVIILSLLLFTFLLTVGYYFDDIRSPAASERSVPAPVE